MDSTSACLDFAVIGHQDSWENIMSFINGLRTADQEKLPVEKIKTTYSFIPPRDVFKVRVRSATGTEINGVYIETFIDPDKLDMSFVSTNIKKVKSAMSWSQKLGAGVAALGGFTSIVLEGNLGLSGDPSAKYTTGNALTSAYIVKALEKAALQKGICLERANILVIGATGDIGAACVEYLKNKVQKLLLCARNNHRLEKLSSRLMKENIQVSYGTSLDDLVPEADVIICVTSSTGLGLTNCKKNVLICDAGYPKNLDKTIGDDKDVLLFHGGMGQVSCGFDFMPDYSKHMYQFEVPYIIHGCILEAMVLAFERRFENYSTGKGNISVDKMEEIYRLSLKHGIDIAPFYNAKGLW